MPDAPTRLDRVPTQPGLLEVKARDDAARDAVRAGARRVEIARRFRRLCTWLVRDGALGYPRLDQLRDLHRRLVDQLHDEIADGATVHRRVPVVVRYLPWLVAVLDGLILYTFCADIFNARTAELTRNGLAALALAILGSGITFSWLSMTGSRLRDYRTPLGEIRWRQTRELTWMLLAGSAVITVTLAVLMYERVSEQAAQAGSTYVATDQVSVLGWVFAILSVCANLTVVAVHALDGSALGAQARRAGRAVRKVERHTERARQRAWRQACRAQACPDPLDDEIGPRAVQRPA